MRLKRVLERTRKVTCDRDGSTVQFSCCWIPSVKLAMLEDEDRSGQKRGHDDRAEQAKQPPTNVQTNDRAHRTSQPHAPVGMSAVGLSRAVRRPRQGH